MSALRLLCYALGLLPYLTLPLPVAAQTDTYGPERPVNPDDPYCCATGTCCLPVPENAAEVAEWEIPHLESLPPRPVMPTAAMAWAAPRSEAAGSCPNPLGLPAPAHADLCNPSVKASIAACARAAKTMLAFRLIDPELGFTTNNYRTNPMEIVADAPDHASGLGLLADYQDALRAYVNHCLTPLDAADGARFVAGDLDRIKARVGVLNNRLRPGFKCAAIAHRGHLLTARHCILETTGKAVISDFGALAFTAINDTKVDGFARADMISTTYYAANMRDAYNPLRNGDDVVGIKLPVGVDFGPDFAKGSAALGDRLMSIGFNTNLRAMDVIAKIIEAPQHHRPFADNFRLDHGQMCRALAQESGCLLHACQTEMQMSGSPIFSRTMAGQLRLSAIQVARIDRLESMSCFADEVSMRIPNAGAALVNLRWP